MKEESLLLLSDLQKLINQVVLIDYTIIILGGKCMQNDISVAALCLNLEQKLMEVWNNELTLERYRKVLAEFTVFAGNSSYSQSLGADFLIARFTERGGLVSTDEHSRKEETYFRCMRMLAEYHNFGIIHRRNDFFGEIVWPGPFRQCTEGFFEAVIKEGLSYGYVTRSRMIIHDLLLFLDARGIHTPDKISVRDNDEFIKSFYGLSPKGIETKLCTLRRYYRHLYLQGYIRVPLAERLPKASIQGRMAFPTVWGQDEIKKIEDSAERISPAGKRSYAMVLLAARLGLRIGDIRNLKLHDIDWTKKQISIIRHKTQKALLLPLPEEVGWAVIDYLKNGRPVTQCFFRRSLATNLLQNNVGINVISEILGHSVPDTAGKYYVQLDLENLKKCALEMEVMDYVRKDS